jgi:hypothetical protein
MKSNALSESEHRSSWQAWLGALVAIIAFAFGAIGLWQYEAQHSDHPDAVSVFYHTLQLFILHAPHLEQATPWQLHVGRWLAAGLVFAAAGKAFVKVFRNELLRLRLWWPWRRGHVVVCGLGDLGLRLALDGRKRKKFVVAIEKEPAPGALERARASGVLVLHGDARDPALLRQARLDRAEFLVAACKDDQDNVAIAALAGQFAPPDDTRATPLVCRLLLHDPKLRATLNKESLFPHTGKNYHVNLNDLDLEDTAARQTLRQHPLDFEPIHEDSDIQVHLVVIGFGQMGQSMALHAARIGHFANEVGAHQKRLRITVVDSEPAAWHRFEADYPNLSKVCDAGFVAQDLNEAGFVAAMAALGPADDKRASLVTYAICLENDDQTNLRLGLELSKQVANRPAQVLIHQTSRNGFAALFPAEGRGAELNPRVQAFGMEEDVFSWDVLLHESEDKLAQALHKDYREKQAAKGVPDKENPVWDNLDEGLKESNRQAADHFPAKLRALGYHDAPLTQEKRRHERFAEKDLLLLAKMEHVRWCAERWLDGWKLGAERNRKEKISDCLVLWEKLPPDKQRIDPEQIEAMVEILHSAGRGIYR